MSVISQRNPISAAPLSIVHLNAYDHHGGVERVISSLVAAQREAGHASVALVGQKTKADSSAIAFETDPDLERREEMRRSGWPDYEFRGSHRLVRHPAVQSADVIHAHNLYGGYFHPLSLIGLSQFRPVVWSMHDMQALTGYCSHALDCTRWETGCGQCPDLTRPGPELLFDNTAALWQSKKFISESSRLWMVAASSWMAAQLERSFLRHHPARLIPNGIETEIFRPRDREVLRQKLGLPADALIVAGLARSGVLAHPLKGASDARTTIEALHRDYPNFVFLNLGSSEPELEPWIRCRLLSSPESVGESLAAADFFLHPSMADTAPLAVMEAMACGLPVIGFRLGGMPDLVTPETGILVPVADTAALIEAAGRLAADAGLRQTMAVAARARAVAHFDRRQMAAAYEQVYREAIATHGQRSLGQNGGGGDAVAGALEEMRLLQGKVLGLEAKLAQFRARRVKDDSYIERLLGNRWLRLGLRLGLVRGAAKDWLRLKKREQERP